MYRNLIAAIASFSLAVGSLLLAVGIHDHGQPEDLTTVWACELQGNYKCGPNEPLLKVYPDNLFRNW